MIYVVKDYYTNEVIASCATRADALQYVLDIAREDNYGIYRYWCKETYEVFDVGFKTYRIEAY